MLPFSGQGQVDAAAKLDEDEVHSGHGGGAPVADGGERKKMQKRRMVGDLVGPIYKGKPVKWARKMRRLKNIIIQLQRRLDFRMAIKTKIR